MDDLKDATAGRKRIFRPLNFSMKDAARTLSLAHDIPGNEMSLERRQALDRLRILQSTLPPATGNHVFRGDIALKVIASSSSVYN